MKSIQHWYGEVLMFSMAPPGPPTGVYGRIWWETKDYTPGFFRRMLGEKPVYLALRMVGGAYEGRDSFNRPITKGANWLHGYWTFYSADERDHFIKEAESHER